MIPNEWYKNAEKNMIMQNMIWTLQNENTKASWGKHISKTINMKSNRKYRILKLSVAIEPTRTNVCPIAPQRSKDE